MMERRDPNMKKSYHSNTVPAADAVSTSLIRAACGFADATAMTSLPFAEIANGPREASQGNYSTDCPIWRRRQSAAVHFCNLANQASFRRHRRMQAEHVRRLRHLPRAEDRSPRIPPFLIQPICSTSLGRFPVEEILPAMR